MRKETYAIVHYDNDQFNGTRYLKHMSAKDFLHECLQLLEDGYDYDGHYGFFRDCGKGNIHEIRFFPKPHNEEII